MDVEKNHQKHTHKHTLIQHNFLTSIGNEDVKHVALLMLLIGDWHGSAQSMHV